MEKEIVLTKEMEEALNIINNTSENLFITGKAGTGKTTLLNYLVNHTTKKCVVSAPTGVAAINAGGQTLHSLFTIQFGPISPNERVINKFSKSKIELLNAIEVLIIDEISMVRPDILDVIDKKLRSVRCTNEPFGGVQVVMLGDLFQLPPVVRSEEKEILDNFYDGYYFFNSIVWKETGFHVIELNKIFRQTDEKFINILNHIRDYNVTPDELDMLSELKNSHTDNMYDENYIHICTHRQEVEKINLSKLGTPTKKYVAEINGKFPESSSPAYKELSLRVGARVMALVNDASHRFHNGSLGIVSKINNDNSVEVKFDTEGTFHIVPYKWLNNQYSLDGDKVKSEEIGYFKQLPLSLAWAITVHKSQGLTFDKIALHINRAFCPGQLYVALSRCRSMEGIISDSYITKRMIVPDESLTDFVREYISEDYWYGHKE